MVYCSYRIIMIKLEIEIKKKASDVYVPLIGLWCRSEDKAV